ncbi:hypothetical protein ES703_67434 [subsurface metagenome]
MAHQDHKMVAVAVQVCPVVKAVAEILNRVPMEGPAKDRVAARVAERTDN